MREEMIALLSDYYGFSPEDALEIFAELKSTESLQQLVTPTPRPAQSQEGAR